MAVIARGQGASPGAATGPIALTPEVVVAFAAQGTPAIFVRTEVLAEDMAGIAACAALVTTRGGITGDGAIAARAMGKPCIAGVLMMRVDYMSKTVLVTGEVSLTLREGETLTVDASRGVLERD